ncbi:hypothetical protein QBC40DRAFT_285641 [Triangularia verruculosa]|uniref:Ubiquitin-like domain-containing protein n=1 Tax=Triangularia verruculosa TaxID=2587418 RepID=A0AAN7AQH8_9PEZI|nr:hypothetical protein QBC40DRAFT_285641 [Triangularia verruculosa]
MRPHPGLDDGSDGPSRGNTTNHESENLVRKIIRFLRPEKKSTAQSEELTAHPSPEEQIMQASGSREQTTQTPPQEEAMSSDLDDWPPHGDQTSQSPAEHAEQDTVDGPLDGRSSETSPKQQILIKLRLGIAVKLDFNLLTATTDDLFTEIGKLLVDGFSMDDFQVETQEKVLKRGQLLSEYNIRHGSTINLSDRLWEEEVAAEQSGSFGVGYKTRLTGGARSGTFYEASSEPFTIKKLLTCSFRG